LSGGKKAQDQGGLVGGLQSTVGKPTEDGGNIAGSTTEGVSNTASSATEGVVGMIESSTSRVDDTVKGVTGSAKQQQRGQGWNALD
jgi:hypothetical protein